MALDSRIAPICEELRALVEERGLSLADVERSAGYSQRYFSKLLNGTIRLATLQIAEILEVVNCDPADFWGRVAARYREERLPVNEDEMDALIRRVTPTVKKVVREFLVGKERGDRDEG